VWIVPRGGKPAQELGRRAAIRVEKGVSFCGGFNVKRKNTHYYYMCGCGFEEKISFVFVGFRKHVIPALDSAVAWNLCFLKLSFH
jgi:hypothetical protein